MEPKMEHVVQFLEDEALGPIRITGQGTDRWKIVFNEPWLPDSKKRCVVTRTRPRWADKDVVVFNSFKSAAVMGDDYKGTFWKFVSLIKGMRYSEAKRWFTMKYMLRDADPRELLDLERDPRDDARGTGTERQIHLPEYFERLDPARAEHAEYVAYLDARRVPRWRFRDMRMFVDPNDRRVVFPVYEDGRLIFWTGRAIDRGSVVPWLSHKAKEWPFPVWNLDNVNGESVTLFEAIFDAAMVHNGVAILGASNRADEVIDKILAKNFVKITVVMDNDDAGRRAREEIAERLSRKHRNVWVYDFKKIEHKDFNSMVVAGVDIDMSGRSVMYGVKSRLAKKMGIIK